MFSGFNANKCKIQCQQCKHRIKLLRNKKHIMLEKLCAEVAALQREGKSGMAWIRIEAVIREDNLLRALEILELFVEMLSQRTALLAKEREIPLDMRGAVASIVFASTRVQELPELKQIRTMFQSKYGSKYIQEVSNENTVVENHNANEQLVQSLIVTPPSENAKFERLKIICAAHDVEFNETQVLNDHDLAQPAALATSGGYQGQAFAAQAFAEPAAPSGVDYIEDYFGKRSSVSTPLVSYSSNNNNNSSGGVPIPNSPEHGSMAEFPASPLAPAPAAQPRWGHVPRAAQSVAAPQAAPADAPGQRPPPEDPVPVNAQRVYHPPAASESSTSAAPLAAAALPDSSLGAPTPHNRYLSEKEYAEAVQIGVKQGIEIAMQAALPFCIPQPAAALEDQQRFTDPPVAAGAHATSAERGVDNSGDFDAALPAVPSPPHFSKQAEFEPSLDHFAGGGGAPGAALSAADGFAAPGAPREVVALSEAEFQRAYEAAQAESNLVAPTPVSSASSVRLPAAEGAGSLFFPAPIDASALAAPSDNPTFAKWAAEQPPPAPPPPPPVAFAATDGEDLDALPSPPQYVPLAAPAAAAAGAAPSPGQAPPAAHSPFPDLSGPMLSDLSGLPAGSASDLSGLPSPPLNLPNAPTDEVLPSPSTTEHYGMSFRKSMKQSGPDAPEADVDAELMSRLNNLKHTDL